MSYVGYYEITIKINEPTKYEDEMIDLFLFLSRYHINIYILNSKFMVL